MAPVTNKRVIFKEPIRGGFVPGETTEFDGSRTIDVDKVALNGGLLLKTLVVALDPYMLPKMWPVRPYQSGYRIGEPITNYGVGVVVRSENPTFQVGDHLYGTYPFEEYSIQTNAGRFRKINNKHGLPWSVFVGIAGMPGHTAYSGWKEFARAKKGEVAFVTSGAGTVGTLAIQLAKRDGLKVISSAGTDEKVQLLRDLGADVAFNYKTTKTSEVLEKEGPIDIYWDNVGGETLEAALDAAATGARFVESGMISAYSGNGQPIRNLINVIIKEISFNGLNEASHQPKYWDAFREEVPALLASKELTHREDITRGLETAEVAFENFLSGAFIGKKVIIVADQ